MLVFIEMSEYCQKASRLLMWNCLILYYLVFIQSKYKLRGFLDSYRLLQWKHVIINLTYNQPELILATIK